MCVFVAVGRVPVLEMALLLLTNFPPAFLMKLSPSSSRIHLWTRLYPLSTTGRASHELLAGKHTHKHAHKQNFLAVHNTMHVTANLTTGRLLEQVAERLLGISTLSPSHLSLSLSFKLSLPLLSSALSPSISLSLVRSIAHSHDPICLPGETPHLTTTQE